MLSYGHMDVKSVSNVEPDKRMTWNFVNKETAVMCKMNRKKFRKKKWILAKRARAMKIGGRFTARETGTAVTTKVNRSTVTAPKTPIGTDNDLGTLF